MNRIFILVVLIGLLLSHSSNAQLLKSYGLKVAFTSATQNFTYTQWSTDITKRRNGINAALFVEWFNGHFISLVTQCEYNPRGMVAKWQRSDEYPPTITVNHNRLDYLSIPIFAKLTIPAGNFNPYLLVGPRFDLLLGYESENNQFDTVYDDFSQTMIGASASIGVELQAILSITLLDEARYNIDLDDSYSTQYLTVRNSAFDIWIGIPF